MKKQWLLFMSLTVFSMGIVSPVCADDLADVQARGVLRHVGVPYANFVTGSGDGMDVELMQKFAEYLGVRYEFVQSTWAEVIGDLTGKKVKAAGSDVEIIADVPIKGDVIANGFTVLPWREKIVDFSNAEFPTQVWLIARADSALNPIQPTGDITTDIVNTKMLMSGVSVFGMANTCLEPSLYKLDETGATVKLFSGNLNEIAPAVINNESEASILDVPDALVALEKWPGQIKVIGPVSAQQMMACGFRKDSPELREAFNTFLQKCKEDGTYTSIVKKYYPAVFDYYADFFADAKSVN